MHGENSMKYRIKYLIRERLRFMPEHVYKMQYD